MEELLENSAFVHGFAKYLMDKTKSNARNRVEETSSPFDDLNRVPIASENEKTETTDNKRNQEDEVESPFFAAIREGNYETYAKLKNKANMSAKGQYDWSALHVAVINGHVDIVEDLLSSGAEVDAETTCGNTALQMAARNGDMGVVNMLLKRNPQINKRDDTEKTALHYAGAEGHYQVVQLLLNKNATIDAVNKNGWTSLHFAAEYGRVQTANILLKNGANVDLKDLKGKAPLPLATIKGHDQIANMLCEAGADVNSCTDEGDTVLHLAVQNNRINIAEILIKKGANVNSINNEMYSVLDLAASRSDSEMVELLVQAGADIHVKGPKGATLLHFAAQNPQGVDVINYLLINGVDINAKAEGGLTALHVAAGRGRANCVRELLNFHANVRAKCDNDHSPLLLATQFHHYDVSKMLIAHGANVVDIIGSDGNTPLPQAAYDGDLELLKHLVAAGANVDHRNHEGRTALHLAAVKNHRNIIDIITFLLVNKANVNARCEGGTSALHVAVVSGRTENVKVLLNFKADVNAKNDAGASSLYAAIRLGLCEIANILIRHGAEVLAKCRDESILHVAVRDVDIFKLVLDEITNKLNGNIGQLRSALNVQDGEGDTPLMRAVQAADASVVKLLLECNEIDVNKQNAIGLTALHWSAYVGHLEIVKLLLDKDADVRIKDIKGRTAYKIAARKIFEDVKYETIADLLLCEKNDTTTSCNNCLVL